MVGYFSFKLNIKDFRKMISIFMRIFGIISGSLTMNLRRKRNAIGGSGQLLQLLKVILDRLQKFSAYQKDVDANLYSLPSQPQA